MRMTPRNPNEKKELNNGSRNQRKLCEYYEEGYCKYGDRCFHIHRSKPAADPRHAKTALAHARRGPAPIPQKREVTFTKDEFPQLKEHKSAEVPQWPSMPSLPPMGSVAPPNTPRDDDDESMDFSIDPEEFLRSVRQPRVWSNDVEELELFRKKKAEPVDWYSEGEEDVEEVEDTVDEVEDPEDVDL